MQIYTNFETSRTLKTLIQTYIEKHQLLSSDGKVIVALSGGADSMALLHLLTALGYDCVAAHCNFHLRDKESNNDAEFVRETCRSMNIPLFVADFDTAQYAKEQRVSIEMAARDLRYDWFYQLVDEQQAQAIAMAHHADDNIETLLMNLVRGTGLRGLTGIPCHNKKVVRPLLCCTRAEIEQYIAENNLCYVTDSTNAETDYRRNKFRNIVIPLLEEINPAVRQTLYDSLKRFEGSFKIYEQAIRHIEREILTQENDKVTIDIPLLKQQIDIMTVLYELLQPYEFNAAIVKQIVDNLDSESGKQFFSEHYRLTKDRATLIVDKINTDKTPTSFFVSATDTEIEHPFRMTMKKLAITSDFTFSTDKNCVHLDASKLQFPLELRLWKAGDTFFPLGMKQQKKLSDFFTDIKLNRPEKERTWLLLSGGEVVWIVGQRLDNRFKITKETKNAVEFKMERG